MPEPRKLVPKPKLLDYHKEREELCRLRERTGQISMRTADGRTISLIHWNPKKRCWEDHKNQFQFRRTGGILEFCRMRRSGKLEEKPFSRCFLIELEGTFTSDGGKIAKNLKGKAIRVANLGTQTKSDLRRAVESHRGVTAAFLDYLKQQGARTAVVYTEREELVSYYRSLGFEPRKEEGFYELELSKWHWPPRPTA